MVASSGLLDCLRTPLWDQTDRSSKEVCRLYGLMPAFGLTDVFVSPLSVFLVGTQFGRVSLGT